MRQVKEARIYRSILPRLHGGPNERHTQTYGREETQMRRIGVSVQVHGDIANEGHERTIAATLDLIFTLRVVYDPFEGDILTWHLTVFVVAPS